MVLSLRRAIHILGPALVLNCCPNWGRIKMAPGGSLHPRDIRTRIHAHPPFSSIEVMCFRSEIVHNPRVVNNGRVVDDDCVRPDWITKMSNSHEHEQRRGRDC